VCFEIYYSELYEYDCISLQMINELKIISMTIHNAKDIILVCYEFFEMIEIK